MGMSTLDACFVARYGCKDSITRRAAGINPLELRHVLLEGFRGRVFPENRESSHLNIGSGQGTGEIVETRTNVVDEVSGQEPQAQRNFFSGLCPEEIVSTLHLTFHPCPVWLGLVEGIELSIEDIELPSRIFKASDDLIQWTRHKLAL